MSLCEIKLPWPGCFAIWDCEIFGLRLPIALSCHARIWNLIFVFFAGAWFNHFLTLIRSLMLCWTLHDYWFVCRLQTWMNMFLCGSSMRKSQIKDLWHKNRVTLKLEFAIQIMQIKVLGTESKCIHWCIDTCFWFQSPKIKYFLNYQNRILHPSLGASHLGKFDFFKWIDTLCKIVKKKMIFI